MELHGTLCPTWSAQKDKLYLQVRNWDHYNDVLAAGAVCTQVLFQHSSHVTIGEQLERPLARTSVQNEHA